MNPLLSVGRKFGFLEKQRRMDLESIKTCTTVCEMSIEIERNRVTESSQKSSNKAFELKSLNREIEANFSALFFSSKWNANSTNFSVTQPIHSLRVIFVISRKLIFIESEASKVFFPFLAKSLGKQESHRTEKKGRTSRSLNGKGETSWVERFLYSAQIDLLEHEILLNYSISPFITANLFKLMPWWKLTISCSHMCIPNASRHSRNKWNLEFNWLGFESIN